MIFFAELNHCRINLQATVETKQSLRLPLWVITLCAGGWRCTFLICFPCQEESFTLLCEVT